MSDALIWRGTEIKTAHDAVMAFVKCSSLEDVQEFLHFYPVTREMAIKNLKFGMSRFYLDGIRDEAREKNAQQLTAWMTTPVSLVAGHVE